MASAQAAQMAPETNNNQQKTRKAAEPAVKKPLLNRPAGIAVGVVLLCAALVVGNGRALQKATPTSFLRQGSVASLVDERITSAKNAESVAKQANLEATYYTEVETAADSLKKAKTAREVSAADQALMTAVGNMTGAASSVLTGNTHLTNAMDTFNDAGNMLRYEAQDYNKKAEKAKKVYEGLPFKFLFGQPDYYEGV